MHLRLHFVLCVCRTQFLKSVDFAILAQVLALSPLFVSLVPLAMALPWLSALSETTWRLEPSYELRLRRGLAKTSPWRRQ